MHKTLKRQLEKIYGSIEEIPKDIEGLVNAVSKTYEDYDKEYALIERSLDISSKELTETNNKLRDEVLSTKERALKLEKLNEMMVDREIKMVELKKEIEELKAKLK